MHLYRTSLYCGSFISKSSLNPCGSTNDHRVPIHSLLHFSFALVRKLLSTFDHNDAIRSFDNASSIPEHKSSPMMYPLQSQEPFKEPPIGLPVNEWYLLRRSKSRVVSFAFVPMIFNPGNTEP